MLVSLQNEEGIWLQESRLDTHIVEYFQAMFLANIERGFMDFLSTVGVAFS